MSNQQSRAERRRAARESATKTVEAQANPSPATEAARLAAVDNAFSGSKPLPQSAANPPSIADVPESETAGETNETPAPKPAPKPVPKPLPAAVTRAAPKTKKEAKREAAAIAKAKLRAEETRMPVPAPDNYPPGATIPLHILNQRAREYDEQAREEAREIGQAAGKFVEQQVSTRVPKSVVRSKKMRDAYQAMDRVRAQKK